MRISTIRYLLLLPFSLLSSGSEPAEPPPAEEPTFQQDNWERFPIVIDGVTVADMDYEFEISPEAHIALSDFADVVTTWKGFLPCDNELATPKDNALNSFSYDWATAYITEANKHGLHTILPLPYFGLIPYDCNDAVWVENDSSNPGYDELWNKGGKIQIPLKWSTGSPAQAKSQISSAFTSYWTDKAEYYVDAIDDYDTGKVVWGWRVIEELRHWRPLEVEFALAQRDTVKTRDGTRPMISYTPGSYLPSGSMLWTLLEKPDGNSSNPDIFTLDPPNPVAREAKSGAVIDHYPQTVDFERDGEGYLTQMFDHVLTGNYVELWFGNNAHTNRIFPYHRNRLGREALDNLAEIYAANSEKAKITQYPPKHTLFHVPGMTRERGGNTEAFARHDFWVGLHEGEGIWIYNFAYKDEGVGPVWEQYVRALHLIKSEMRPYLASGNKSVPSGSNEGVVQTSPGDYYIDLENWGDYAHLAMPDTTNSEYPLINQTLFRVADIGYLIVTNSYEQHADFEVEFADCIDDAEMMSGSSGELDFEDTTLLDSFDGIDGRVYKITFITCPGSPD